MSSQLRVIVWGVVVVLAFDALASLASKSFGFSYGRASIGSYIIYLGIGYFAARSAANSPLLTAALAAAIAGLADASVGWFVSWQLGPGKLPEGVTLTASRWLATAIIVVALAAAVGAIGGLAARRQSSVHGSAT